MTVIAEPATRYALLVAYEGTAYRGWQVQPDAPTVQGQLQDALRPLTGGEALPVGASRTDAGVHAMGQVAAVTLPRQLPEARLRAALNGALPTDIRVLAVRRVGHGFDARRSARLKRYAYLIDTAPVASPFLSRYAWHLPERPFPEAIRRALPALRGQHDFTAFCAAAGRGRHPICTVRSLRVVEHGAMITILLSADAFLHHMVRNIVGSAVEIGRGRRSAGWLAEVLAGRDRRTAGPTAPAHGLTLLGVRYPAEWGLGGFRRDARAGPGDRRNR